MQPRWVLGVVGLGALALVGCAVGSAGEDVSESDLATAPIDAGDDSPSITLKPPAPPPASSDDDAGSYDDDAGAYGDDAGTSDDSGTPPPPPPPPPPPTVTCDAPNTCAGATDLGSVSGDDGGDSLVQSGETSQWFTVRVTEDDSSVFSNSLEMLATLTSPPGANFDLYVYVPGGDTRECATASKSSTTTGFDSAGVEFGEGGTFSNGDDDDRTVTVEVRSVSGTCAPGQKWTLNIYGNVH
jgi:hypothetical protein